MSKPQRCLWMLLVLALLLSSLTGCALEGVQSSASFGEFFQTGKELQAYPLSLNTKGQVDDLGLVQALAAGISDPSLIPEIYESMSQPMLDGLSFEQFRQYIMALRPTGQERILSYERLEPATAEALQHSIVLREPQLANVAAHSKFFSLAYERKAVTRKDKEASCLLAVQVREDGSAYVAKPWATAVVRLRDFSQLYFDALQNHDLDSLSFLLEIGSRPFAQGDWKAYTSLRAAFINDFYLDEVTTEPAASFLQSLLPGEAIFTQEQRLSSLTGTREVAIRELSGSFYVREPIRQSILEEDQELRIFNAPLFPEQIGYPTGIIDQDSLHPLAGLPLEIRALEGEAETYLIRYFGMEMHLMGEVDIAQKSFRGRIRQLRFDSRIFQVGPVLRVGEASATLFMRYPAIQENDFSLKDRQGLTPVQLDLQLAGEKISRILLFIQR